MSSAALQDPLGAGAERSILYNPKPGMRWPGTAARAGLGSACGSGITYGTSHSAA